MSGVIHRFFRNRDAISLTQRRDAAVAYIGFCVAGNGIGHNGSAPCGTTAAATGTDTDSTAVVFHCFLAVCQNSYCIICRHGNSINRHSGIIFNFIGSHVACHRTAHGRTAGTDSESDADIQRLVGRNSLCRQIVNGKLTLFEFCSCIGITLDGRNGTAKRYLSFCPGTDSKGVRTVSHLTLAVRFNRHVRLFTSFFVFRNRDVLHACVGIAVERCRRYAALPGYAYGATSCPHGTA